MQAVIDAECEGNPSSPIFILAREMLRCHSEFLGCFNLFTFAIWFGDDRLSNYCRMISYFQFDNIAQVTRSGLFSLDP